MSHSFFLGSKIHFPPAKAPRGGGGVPPTPAICLEGRSGHPTLPPPSVPVTPWPPAAARGQDVTYVEDRWTCVPSERGIRWIFQLTRIPPPGGPARGPRGAPRTPHGPPRPLRLRPGCFFEAGDPPPRDHRPWGPANGVKKIKIRHNFPFFSSSSTPSVRIRWGESPESRVGGFMPDPARGEGALRNKPWHRLAVADGVAKECLHCRIVQRREGADPGSTDLGAHAHAAAANREFSSKQPRIALGVSPTHVTAAHVFKFKNRNP